MTFTNATEIARKVQPLAIITMESGFDEKAKRPGYRIVADMGPAGTETLCQTTDKAEAQRVYDQY